MNPMSAVLHLLLGGPECGCLRYPGLHQHHCVFLLLYINAVLERENKIYRIMYEILTSVLLPFHLIRSTCTLSSLSA